MDWSTPGSLVADSTRAIGASSTNRKATFRLQSPDESIRSDRLLEVEPDPELQLHVDDEAATVWPEPDDASVAGSLALQPLATRSGSDRSFDGSAGWQVDSGILDPAGAHQAESATEEIFRDYSPRGRWQGLVGDYSRFYAPQGLGNLSLGLLAGAAMAHTNIDSFLNEDFYQETIRNARTDELMELFHEPKILGEGKYAIPLYVALALTQPWTGSGIVGANVGEWGDRSLRTILVGGPAVLVLQRVLGGSRPGESDAGSHWTPFQDNNAVSGHAFMGAVPFLSAARMTDRPMLKGILYAGSALPALSRINDQGHYPSQAFLGWYLALLASRAVEPDGGPRRAWSVSPWLTGNHAGLMWERRF